jgi:uncharacterized membrane protein
MISVYALAVLFISLLFGTTGTFFLKKGAKSFSLDPFKAIKNIYVISGLAFYVISILIYTIALKLSSLSILYPLTSFSYVIVFIISAMFLEEKITKAKLFGITFIIFGSFLVVL